jgi:hypothetical protein
MSRAYIACRWKQTVTGTRAENEIDLGALGWLDLTVTPGANLPPAPNVVVARVDSLPDKATLDALDATPGVIVLAAVNDDGSRVTGYLRPQDTPTGAQLSAAKTRLQNAGVPTAFLTANITVGMTLAQIADVLRAWARDLARG